MKLSSVTRLLRAALIPLLLALTPAAHAAEPIDRIIVVVNDGIILQSELDQAMSNARRGIESRGITAPPDDVLRSQVLDRLILNRLQTQKAKEAGIHIDDRELNDILSGIAKKNGMNLAQFADALRGEGMDYLAVREQVRDEALIQRLRAKEVDSRITVTEQDVDSMLANQGADADTEYRLSHILVALPEGASAQTRDKVRAKAEDLLKQLRDGADFAEVAIAHSDGQQALNGGDLDWRHAADLPPAFATAAAKLSPGEISGLIPTSGGFHIIKLVDERGGIERKTVVETHAAHILIQTNAVRDDDQARALTRDIYQRLQNGEDFAKMAKQYSDDPGSKNSGGDLGFQPPGVFAPDFQVRIDQLKPGEMSPPFRTQFGWHIAKVIERQTRDVTEETRRAAARSAIAQRKGAEEYDTWLRRLRNEAYVEYRLPEDAKSAKSDS